MFRTSHILTTTALCCSMLVGGRVSSQEVEHEKSESDRPVIAAIEAIRSAGGQVMKIAANTDEYEASFQLSSKPIRDEHLAYLKSIPKLVWLNLANTKITDEGLEHLSQLPLKKLHLEKTQIGNQGLAHLKALKNLEYLNLYSTRVTDDGLDQLRQLKNLKRLYVWQTGVTEAGIKRLNESLPDLVIVGEIMMIEPVVEDAENDEGDKDKDEHDGQDEGGQGEGGQGEGGQGEGGQGDGGQGEG